MDMDIVACGHTEKNKDRDGANYDLATNITYTGPIPVR